MPTWFYPALAAAGLALMGIGFWLGGHTESILRLLRRLRRPALDLDQLYALYDAQLYDRALELCDRVLDVNPHDPDALFHRGLSLVSLERYDEALAALAALALRHPGDVHALHQAAYCLFRSNMPHSALAFMDHVTALEPDDMGFALSRADVLSDLGHQEEALDRFARMAPSDEKEVQIAIAWGMATCYTRMEQYGAAADAYERALALGCDDPECRLLLSQALQQGGRSSEALDVALKQILLTPDFGPAYNQAARLLLAAGEPEQALSYLEQASTRMGDPFYYERARCLAALGRADEAMAQLEKMMWHEGDFLRDFLRQQGQSDFPALWGDPRMEAFLTEER